LGRDDTLAADVDDQSMSGLAGVGLGLSMSQDSIAAAPRVALGCNLLRNRAPERYKVTA
jgi:hypothetical protein